MLLYKSKIKKILKKTFSENNIYINSTKIF